MSRVCFVAEPTKDNPLGAGRHRKDYIPVTMRLSPECTRKLDVLRHLIGTPSGGGNIETYNPVIEYILSLTPVELHEETEKKLDVLRGFREPSKGWNDLTYGPVLEYLLSLVPEERMKLPVKIIPLGF